jgi:hypothetical protein
VVHLLCQVRVMRCILYDDGYNDALTLSIIIIYIQMVARDSHNYLDCFCHGHHGNCVS